MPTPVAPDPRPLSQEPLPAPIPPPSNTTNATSLTTPTTTTTPPLQANNDHIVQAALTSVLNSPTQMQKLLAALAAQSLSPEVFSAAAQPHPQQHLIAPSPYNNNVPQYPPSINPPPPPNIHPNATASPRLPATFDYAAANALSPFTLSLLGAPSDPDPFALQQQDDRLQKSYKNTAEINDDVDELQTNIQSLIQSLGIDPTTLDSVMPPAEAAIGVGGGGDTSAPLPAGDVDMFPPVHMGSSQDFDFDAFLMDMPRANEDDGDLDKLAERLDPSTVVVPKASDVSKIGSASSEQLHAFLDEVASQDGSEGVGGGVPPPAFQVPSGAVSGGGVGVNVGAGAGTRGRKRKSDVIVDGAQTYAPQEVPSGASSITNNRSKRKR